MVNMFELRPRIDFYREIGMKLWFIVSALLLGACGQQGPVGPRGPSGLDGTTITTVQFCSGTTTYPTTFNEVGFCINGVIWAVYSANNGFLTEVPPGNYSSNAIGSSCSFTVLPGCIIN